MITLLSPSPIYRKPKQVTGQWELFLRVYTTILHDGIVFLEHNTGFNWVFELLESNIMIMIISLWIRSQTISEKGYTRRRLGDQIYFKHYHQENWQ